MNGGVLLRLFFQGGISGEKPFASQNTGNLGRKKNSSAASRMSGFYLQLFYVRFFAFLKKGKQIVIECFFFFCSGINLIRTSGD